MSYLELIWEHTGVTSLHQRWRPAITGHLIRGWESTYQNQILLKTITILMTFTFLSAQFSELEYQGCQGFWSPLCMPVNCSTYNLNEALTFNLLSLHQFLFFAKWLDFLKVPPFSPPSLFSSSLSLNQSHCLFVSHFTRHASSPLIRCVRTPYGV